MFYDTVDISGDWFVFSGFLCTICQSVFSSRCLMEQHILSKHGPVDLGLKRFRFSNADMDTVYPPKKRALFDYNREQAKKTHSVEKDNPSIRIDENVNRHAFYNTKLKLDRHEHEMGMRPRSDSLHSSNSQYSETSSLSSASRETSPVTVNGIFDHETPERNPLHVLSGLKTEIQKPLFTQNTIDSDLYKPISKSLFPLNSENTLSIETKNVRCAYEPADAESCDMEIMTPESKEKVTVKRCSENLESDIPCESPHSFQCSAIPTYEDVSQKIVVNCSEKHMNTASITQEPKENSKDYGQELVAVQTNEGLSNKYYVFSLNETSSSRQVTNNGSTESQNDDSPRILSDVTNCIKVKKKLDERTSNVREIYKCSVCNKEFRQSGNFHSHMQLHMEANRICKCGVCGLDFNDSDSLQAHMRSQHTGSHPYKCEHCNREFNQFNNLRRHLRVHRDKIFKCNLCDRVFNEEFYLKMHMGTHTGQRVYSCGVCNVGFTSSQELKSHVKTHSPSELHVCNICGKAFSKACVLRQHKKAHSGERPHKCTACSKTFIHRHHLTMHMRSHTEQKPYICDICNKEFSQTSHLYKHLKQHEDDNAENIPVAYDQSTIKRVQNVANVENAGKKAGISMHKDKAATIKKLSKDDSNSYLERGKEKSVPGCIEESLKIKEKKTKTQKLKEDLDLNGTQATTQSFLPPVYSDTSTFSSLPVAVSPSSVSLLPKLPPFTSVAKISVPHWPTPSPPTLSGHHSTGFDQAYQTYGFVGNQHLSYDPRYLAYSAQMQAYYNMIYYNSRVSLQSQCRNKEATESYSHTSHHLDSYSHAVHEVDNYSKSVYDESRGKTDEKEIYIDKETKFNRLLDESKSLVDKGTQYLSTKSPSVKTVTKKFLKSQFPDDDKKAIDQDPNSITKLGKPDESKTETLYIDFNKKTHTDNQQESKSSLILSDHKNSSSHTDQPGISEHLVKMFNLRDKFILEKSSLDTDMQVLPLDSSEIRNHKSSSQRIVSVANSYESVDISGIHQAKNTVIPSEHSARNNPEDLTEYGVNKEVTVEIMRPAAERKICDKKLNYACNNQNDKCKISGLLLEKDASGNENRLKCVKDSRFAGLADDYFCPIGETEAIKKIRQIVGEVAYETNKRIEKQIISEDHYSVESELTDPATCVNSHLADELRERKLEIVMCDDDCIVPSVSQYDEVHDTGRDETADRDENDNGIETDKDSQKVEVGILETHTSIEKSIKTKAMNNIDDADNSQVQEYISCDTCKAQYSSKTDLKIHFLQRPICFSKVCANSKISEEFGWQLLDCYLSSLHAKKVSENVYVPQKGETEISKTNEFLQTCHIANDSAQPNRQKLGGNNRNVEFQCYTSDRKDARQPTETSGKQNLENNNHHDHSFKSENSVIGLLKPGQNVNKDCKESPELTNDMGSLDVRSPKTLNALVKEFSCELCGEMFGKQTDLKKHMKSHSNAKPYICTICNRDFSHRHNLKKHMVSHSDKSVQCSLCGRNFRETFYLQMHMKVHSDESCQKCEICGELVSKSDLSEHVNSHIGPIEENPTYAQIAGRVKEIMDDNDVALDLSQKNLKHSVTRASLMKMNVEQLKNFMIKKTSTNSNSKDIDNSSKDADLDVCLKKEYWGENKSFK